EGAVGIHGLRPELAGAHHGVGNVVAVGPGHGLADLDRELGRLEDEIVDVYGHGSGCFLGAGGTDGEERGRDHEDAEVAAIDRTHCRFPLQPCSGVSMLPRRLSTCLKVMLATPSRLRSLLSSTFIGPGEGAEPGAGCGKAVERAVWKVTLPSTFCITWWMWPLSTVTEPKPLRYPSASAPAAVPPPPSGYTGQ